ncbi:hypothetical protein EVAR_81744_1 [Eumeta japonica]|uniref:Uncharacterized protein n=1 Tax=Eumeta variegata TaxID=151549 RepID=A0A4C1UHA7_EUMVA|nr:hypothetical protein EVAR_81744_1 [Eumeta japonica]
MSILFTIETSTRDSVIIRDSGPFPLIGSDVPERKNKQPGRRFGPFPRTPLLPPVAPTRADVESCTIFFCGPGDLKYKTVKDHVSRRPKISGANTCPRVQEEGAIELYLAGSPFCADGKVCQTRETRGENASAHRSWRRPRRRSRPRMSYLLSIAGQTPKHFYGGQFPAIYIRW